MRTTHVVRRGTVVATIVLWTLVGPIAVEPAAAQDVDEVFEASADVLEVQVPVNVVGRAGEPLRGLTQEDFTVFEGGREQPIVDFQVVDLEVVQPGESRTEIDSAVPSAARRHFLLLFDLSFSQPAAILKAREAARRFVLDTLRPTDLAAVAVHDAEWGPRLVVTFTPDRLQLVRAIDTLGAQRALAGRSPDPLRFLVEEPTRTASPGISDPLVERPSADLGPQSALVLDYLNVIGKVLDRSEKSYSRGRIFSWSESMSELARMLDSVKGRKHVVLFSEGFDGRLLLGRNPDAHDPEALADRFNIEFGNLGMVDSDDIYGSVPLQNAIGDMLEEFRRADAVIQAVDISGLGSDSAEARRAKSTGQDALFYMANETGGELFEDTNNFDHKLQELLQHTSVTYLLTIRPRDLDYDGEYHSLRVRVDAEKGARAYYRQGFYAPRPFEQLHPFEKTLMASDAIASAEVSRDIPVNVLAAPFRATPTEAYVPVIIEIDGDGLIEGQTDDQLAVELYAYVTDGEGVMRDFFTQLVSLDISKGRKGFAQGGLKYYGHLDLGPGEHLVRVLVRNSSTGRTGVQTARVRIPRFEADEGVLLPPFFFDPANRWTLVREPRNDNYQASVIYPFTINGQPFVPAARPIVAGSQDSRLCLVAYNLAQGRLELEGRVLNDDGEPVQGGDISLVERTVTGIEGLDKLLVSFEPGGLRDGDYKLQVALRGTTADKTLTSTIPITVSH